VPPRPPLRGLVGNDDDGEHPDEQPGTTQVQTGRALHVSYLPTASVSVANQNGGVWILAAWKATGHVEASLSPAP
jgi:hypothetical protein